MSALSRLGLLAVALLASACQSISYQPNVTIGSSPQKIPLRVALRDLQDVSPQEDRSPIFGGTSAVAPDSLSGSASTAVSEALLTSFRNDSVFSEIRRRPDAPELIMGGRIRRFSGKAYIQRPWGYVAVVPYFIPALLGAPVYMSEVHVELEVTLERVGGKQIASYSASREYSAWSTLYYPPQLGIGTKLNEQLSVAAADIRQQMIADRDRLVREAQSPAP